MSSSQGTPKVPGFVTVVLDVPFCLALPNGSYRTFDRIKGIAIVQTTQREGSRAFFRDRPITGPTSFSELKDKAREYERPRDDYSYVAASRLKDGREKATLNIHGGADGGFAETKYYSEIQVTFLEDDLNVLRSKDHDMLQRTIDILNPFLDKYRLFLEDYRTENISVQKNFFFATCHSSPLSVEEQTLTVEQLLSGLSKGRTFYSKLGHGGANILRPNSFDRLGPKAELGGTQLKILASFLSDQYEMPLSYDLIMQALRSLQIDHDFKLTIVHAATAVEVHVLNLLHNLLKASGRTDTEAWNLLENDPEYEGVTKRLKRLESHAKDYCNVHGFPYKPFVGTNLYKQWKDVLAHKRNRAVHAGVASFSWTEATEALSIAKETIGILDQRIPSLANRLQLTPIVTGIFEGPGGIRF